jgi:hypothetical protein
MGQSIRASFPAWAKDLSLCYSIHTGYEAHAASYLVSGVFSLGLKQLGYEAEHSVSLSDDIKKEKVQLYLQYPTS